VEFDPLGSGFITTHELRPLLKTMAPPLGYKKADKETKTKLINYMAASDIPVYNENNYHFYEVCSELAKFIYADRKEGNEELEDSNKAF
jgi:hypothetical protein